MKKSIILSIAFLVVLCTPSKIASAQNPMSGYFLDNYTYGYRLNPAIMPEKSFFAIGIGNISAGVVDKLGVGSFLFPGPDGSLISGLNKAVPSADFLSKFSDINEIGENIDYNLLSFGIRSDKSASTVELNLRENLQMSLPRGLFSFLKEGSSQYPYDLSSLNAETDAMIELALGHSRKYKNFVFGLRTKFLFGAARAEAAFDKLDLLTNQGVLAANANALIKVACKPLAIMGSTNNSLYVDDVDFALNNVGLAGFGIRLDLGAKWYISDNLSVTLGINDLGAMPWSYNNVLKADADTKFEGLKDVDAKTDIGQAFNDIIKEIKDNVRVSEADKLKELSFLPFNVNAGVRYRMPFYKRLSVGGLVNYDYTGYSSIVSARAGATLSPINWFSLTGNIGVSNYGNLAGCMASLTLFGVNICAGADCYIGKHSSMPSILNQKIGQDLPVQDVMIPLNAYQYRFNAGINFQFGKRRADY